MAKEREPLPEESARLESLIKRIEGRIPLKEFGFDRRTTLIARFNPHIIFPPREWRFPTVIYDSSLCRVSFVLQKNQTQDELSVAYGRSHAPDDEVVLLQNVAPCRCWHWDIHRVALKFLDGLSPREAVLNMYEPPLLLKEFMKVDRPKTREQVESVIYIHEAIWRNYGERLFPLFDIKNTRQWEQYTAFVKEYFDLYRHGKPSGKTPPEEDIC